jgi:homoserine O-acetyltransferase/O-succinyltransferase
VARVARGDANDSLSASDSIEDYSPEPDLPKIKAKMLLINTVEDAANPPELGTVERAMKAIHDGHYVLIPYSDQTRGHFTHYYAAVWKPYLVSFTGSARPGRGGSVSWPFVQRCQ